VLRMVHQPGPDSLRQAASSSTTMLLRMLEAQCRPSVR
jgi:hypothetical protein